MTITSQQVDAWDAAVDAAYEAGRQEGMKQERALWELSRLGQEIEAQRQWAGLTDKERSEIYNRMDWVIDFDWEYERAIEAKLKEKNTCQE